MRIATRLLKVEREAERRRPRGRCYVAYEIAHYLIPAASQARCRALAAAGDFAGVAAELRASVPYWFRPVDPTKGIYDRVDRPDFLDIDGVLVTLAGRVVEPGLGDYVIVVSYRKEWPPGGAGRGRDGL